MPLSFSSPALYDSWLYGDTKVIAWGQNAHSSLAYDNVVEVYLYAGSSLAAEISLDALVQEVVPVQDAEYRDSEPPDEFLEILALGMATGEVEPLHTLMDVFRQSDAIDTGAAELSRGVSREQAEKLWQVYDADGSGFLEREEVAHLVVDLGNAAVRRLSDKMAALMVAIAE